MAAVANATVHYSVWSDQRYELLAMHLSVTRFDAIGRMALLWSECTDRETDVPPEWIVNACLGTKTGGGEILERSGLAEKVAEGYRIRGCRERIEWLAKKRLAAKKGGQNSAKSRQAKVKQPKASLKHRAGSCSTDGQAPVQASVQAPLEHQPTDAQPSGTQVLRDSGTQESNNSGTQKAASSPSALDFFHERFKQAYGTAPDWKGKNAKLIHELAGAHGNDEVIRRTKILFDSPPDWLKPPFDVGTLKSVFDRLVIAPKNIAVGQYRVDPDTKFETGEVDL